MNEPLAICLIGAECTGKTTLAGQLAAHFDGLWVAEYLRTFCSTHGRTPTRAEQTQIMETQAAHEREAMELARRKKKALVFCDSAPLLTAIYSEFIFSDRSLFAQAHTLHARFALTLNLLPDIPWVADGIQRDGVQVQAPLQALIERELIAMSWPCSVVAGSGDTRLQAAVAAVQTRLNNDGRWAAGPVRMSQ